MFKNTSAFNAAAYKILKNLRDGDKNFSNVSAEFGEEELNEALALCVERGYVSGYTYHRNEMNEPVFDYVNPKITYSGLEFMESM